MTWRFTAGLAACVLFFVAGVSQAQILQNGDFEGSPFDDFWVSRPNNPIASAAGIAPGSTTAALIPSNALGGSGNGAVVTQESTDPGDWLADFELDHYFQIDGSLGTDRTYNLRLEETLTGNGRVNTRVDSLGNLQVFNGAWTTVPGAENFFAADQVYRIQYIGRNWGADFGSTIGIAWSNAGSSDLTNFADLTSLTNFGFQDLAVGPAANGLPRGLSRIYLSTEFQAAGDPGFIVDDFTLAGPTVLEWASTGGGNTSVGTNWVGGTAPNRTADWTFGANITGPANIDVDGSVPAGNIVIDNSNSITISSLSELALRGGISAVQGSHTVTANLSARGAVFTAESGANLDITGELTTPSDTAQSYILDGDGNGSIGIIRDVVGGATGNIGIIKRGTGSWTIGPATDLDDDHHFGGTTVEAGRLIVAAGVSGEGELRSPITVRSGAIFDATNFSNYRPGEAHVLSGGGTIEANTFTYFNDNFINPGDGVGTLTIDGNLILSGEFGDDSGRITFELSDSTAGGNDLLEVTGTLAENALGSTINIAITPTNGTFATGSYTLIDAATGRVGLASVYAVTIVDSNGVEITDTRVMTSPNTSSETELRLDVSGGANLTWTGANGADWDVATTQNWDNGGSADPFFNLDKVSFDSSGAETTVNVVADVNSGGMDVSSSYTFTGAGITGTGGLNITGGSANGDFNSDGSVDLADYTVWRNNLGAIAGTLPNDNTGQPIGTAQYNLWKANFGQTGTVVTLANGTNSFSGDVNVGAGSTLVLGDGVSSLNVIGPDNNITVDGTLVGNDGNGEGLAGDISGSGTIVAQLSDLAFTGTSSFSGTYEATGGRLLFFDNDSIGSPTSMAINSGGSTVYVDVTSNIATPTSIRGGSLRVAGDSSGINLSGPITVGAGGEAEVRVDGGIDTVELSGNISGTSGEALRVRVDSGSQAVITGIVGHNGDFRKNFEGTLTLQGNTHTYTGNTELINGTLALTGDASIDSSPTIQINEVATLDVSGHDGFAVANSQTLTGTGTVVGNVTQTNGSSIRVGADGISFLPNTTQSEDFEGETPGVVFTGNSQSGLLSWQLIDGRSSTSSQLGNDDAVFEITNNAVTGSIALEQTNANTDFPTGGNPHNGSMAISPLDTSGTVDTITAKLGQNDPSGGFADAAIVFGFVDQDNYNYAQVAQNGQLSLFVVQGDIRSNVLITDVGSFANNTAWDITLVHDARTGEVNFTVDDGTAQGPQSITATNTAFLVDGLVGAGSHNDAWFIDDLSVTTGSPADIIFELTIDGDFTGVAGSSIDLDLASVTGYDRLVVGNILTAGGDLNVNGAVGFTANLNDTFDILDFDSASGTFDLISLPTLGAGLDWDTSQLLVDGSITVIAAGAFSTAAVPEPSSIAILALGASCLLLVRRRS